MLSPLFFIQDTFLLKKESERVCKGLEDFPRSDSHSLGDTGLEILKMLIEGLIETMSIIVTSFG